MIVLGLLLVLAGVLVVLAALLTTDGTAEMLGNDLTGLTIFLLGLAAGLAILWGYVVLRFGARRSLERRRERKKLGELSQKLEQVEAERRAERADRPTGEAEAVESPTAEGERPTQGTEPPARVTEHRVEAERRDDDRDGNPRG